MTDIEWGAEIAVDGVRPEWLRQSDTVNVHTGAGWVAVHDGTKDRRSPPLADWPWSHSSGRPCITHIRLPANHAYYKATSRGFTYWQGGESAPEDWDESPVLLRDGEMWAHADATEWQELGEQTVIGYRKRIEQPAPAIAPELVERMVALVRDLGKYYEGAFYNSIPWVVETKAILAELEPDPDLTLAKSIVGDAEAIALAIKAARENAK